MVRLTYEAEPGELRSVTLAPDEFRYHADHWIVEVVPPHPDGRRRPPDAAGVPGSGVGAGEDESEDAADESEGVEDGSEDGADASEGGEDDTLVAWIPRERVYEVSGAADAFRAED